MAEPIQLMSVCCVFIHTEVMWLRVWPAAGGVQRSARVHSSNCMWWHTWTGKNQWFISERPQKHFVTLTLQSVYIQFNVYIPFFSLCVLVLWSLWTLPNWWPGSRHKLHIYGLYIISYISIYLYRSYVSYSNLNLRGIYNQGHKCTYANLYHGSLQFQWVLQLSCFCDWMSGTQTTLS